MRSTLGLAILVAMVSPAHAAPAMQFHVDFAELPNLTYQLDCVTGHTQCAADDFQALWTQQFLKTDQDRERLAAWKAARDRYELSYELPQAGTFAIEPPPHGVSVGRRIAIAGLQARSIADYVERLDLLVAPRDRAAFEDVVRYFEPRFALWWKKSAARGATFSRKTKQLLGSPTITGELERFLAFYQPQLPRGYVAGFDLMLLPGLVESNSTGQTLDGRLVVEFGPDEDPRERIDVVLHELCHFLRASRTPQQEVALQDQLVKQRAELVVPASNLLDEALATALGNGVVYRSMVSPEQWKKYVAQDQSFYSSADIDRAAKALLPLVDEWLAKHGSIDDPEFAARYVTALADAFGDQLASPRVQLGHGYVFVDDALPEGLVDAARDVLHMGIQYSDHDRLDHLDLAQFEAIPNGNALFIVPPAALDQLAARKLLTTEEVRQLTHAGSARGLLFARHRNRYAYTYIIVAPTAAIAKQQLDALANAPTAFLGLR